MAVKGKRIFIIEDNVGNRVITQLLLEQAGAITAMDRWGVDVIKKLDAFEPVDLILLDLMLPNNVTGYQIFDEIRDYPRYHHVPIVAVSAADPTTAVSE